MKNIELNQLSLRQLTEKELGNINGGFLALLVAYALQATVVGTLAMGVYASFERGYNQAIN